MEQSSIVRAALLVAFAALLEAVLGPYLTFAWVSPKLTLLGIVFAVAPLRDLQPVLLGFFGGILFDALSGGRGAAVRRLRRRGPDPGRAVERLPGLPARWVAVEGRARHDPCLGR